MFTRFALIVILAVMVTKVYGNAGWGMCPTSGLDDPALATLDNFDWYEIYKQRAVPSRRHNCIRFRFFDEGVTD